MPVSKQRRRLTPRPRHVVVQGAGKTAQGLPYSTLDRPLEELLDLEPHSISRLPQGLRARMAVKLRLGGANWDQIAEKLGYRQPETPQRLVQRIIDRSYELDPEEVTTLVKSDLMRLDTLQLTFWQKALRGDEKAAKLVLEMMQERRKLLGIEDTNQGGGLQVHINAQEARTLVIGGNEEDFINQLRQARGEEPRALTQGNGHRADVVDAEVIDPEVGS